MPKKIKHKLYFKNYIICMAMTEKEKKIKNSKHSAHPGSNWGPPDDNDPLQSDALPTEL